jgi:uncharacterized protein (DUF305 family)
MIIRTTSGSRCRGATLLAALVMGIPCAVHAQSEAAAIAKAKADSARYPYTAADVHFMTAMIGHHAQAIVMSEWAPTHRATSSVRILAERIINAQQDEIASMQQWLRDRLQPVPRGGAAGARGMIETPR